MNLFSFYLKSVYKCKCFLFFGICIWIIILIKMCNVVKVISFFLRNMNKSVLEVIYYLFIIIYMGII